MKIGKKAQKKPGSGSNLFPEPREKAENTERTNRRV